MFNLQFIKFFYVIALVSIFGFFSMQIGASLNTSNNSSIQLRPDYSSSTKSSSSSVNFGSSSSLIPKPTPVTTFIDPKVETLLNLKGWVGSVDMNIKLTLKDSKLAGEYKNPIDSRTYKLEGVYESNKITLKEKLSAGLGGIITLVSESDESNLSPVLITDIGSVLTKRLHGNYEFGDNNYDVFLTNNSTDYGLVSLPKESFYNIIGNNGRTYFLRDNVTGAYFFSNEDWVFSKYKQGTNVKISSKIRSYSATKSFSDKQLPGSPSQFPTNSGLFQITTNDVQKSSSSNTNSTSTISSKTSSPISEETLKSVRSISS